MLHVHRVLRLEEMDCLEAAWDALLDPGDAYAPFLGHAWARAWFGAYGAGRTPHVLVVRRAAQVVGILPLSASRPRFAGLQLRSLDLMANGHSPCADLVARPQDAAAVAEALARHLQDDDSDWDLATFPEVQVGARLEALCARFGAGQRHAQAQRRAPYIPLDGDWEAYRGSLSKNFQRTLRNNRNRVARAGRADVRLLEHAGDIEPALGDVFAIGDRSWQGSAGSAVGSDADNRAFYTGIVRALAPLGRVRLWFLELDGRRIAFELHVAGAGVEFGLKTGYDRDFESIGAGTYLDQHIVERLFAEKRWREYDLLGNADFYKLRWTEHGRDYCRHVLFGAGAQARLVSLWNLKLKPALRPAIRQARALRRAAAGAP